MNKPLFPLILISLISLGGMSNGVAADSPKLVAPTIRLQDDPSYIRKNPAPDYWALSPYYTGQLSKGTCSVAALSMALNAIRSSTALTAADELVHETDILKKFDAMKLGHDDGIGGVSLDGMERIANEALKLYKITGVRVEKLRTDHNDAATRAKVIELLRANEKSAKDVIIPLFLQKDFTGDPEGAVGHFAPVAAFDEKKMKVLILDPDRDYYEPYWVTVDQFMTGITDPKADSKLSGGLIRLVKF